ncbi:hypothetical protein [Flavobacterium sp. TAB 87]|uniref:hypothetical protein n=1 Tax=Flavobacterium sp. TAB 87 TaxID=1729581 RepID=UPI0012F992E0|nr:hypothetical protein [Flavobacterium sp. TAB 87]
MYKDERSLTVILEKILKKGKKYNTIDRLIYFKIEEKKLRSIINSTDLHGYWIEDYKYEFLTRFNYVIDSLKHTIIHCFGLYPFEAYSRTKKTTIIDNPFFLGISPFLFHKDEWVNFIINDIKKCENINLCNIESIIISSLTDVLYRLGEDYFLIQHSYSAKTFTDYSPIALFSLLVDDIFELIQNNKNQDLSILKSEKNETIFNKIILRDYTTGNIIDDIIRGFKGDKVLSEYEKQEIRKFVSHIFQNRKGKCIVYKENIDTDFIANNIKIIKKSLTPKRNDEMANWTNKQISEIIHRIIPNHFKLKTIENY